MELTPLQVAPLWESEDVVLFGEVVAGRHIEAGTASAALTAEEWLERWRRLRARRPEIFGAKPR